MRFLAYSEMMTCSGKEQLFIRIFLQVVLTSGVSNGGFPINRVQMITPNDQQSTSYEWPIFPSNISGAYGIVEVYIIQCSWEFHIQFSSSLHRTLVQLLVQSLPISVPSYHSGIGYPALDFNYIYNNINTLDVSPSEHAGTSGTLLSTSRNTALQFQLTSSSS